ncbi:MAG: hypothetical protein ACYDBP_04585 [Leptospirales bacterium]
MKKERLVNVGKLNSFQWTYLNIETPREGRAVLEFQRQDLRGIRIVGDIEFRDRLSRQPDDMSAIKGKIFLEHFKIGNLLRTVDASESETVFSVAVERKNGKGFARKIVLVLLLRIRESPENSEYSRKSFGNERLDCFNPFLPGIAGGRFERFVSASRRRKEEIHFILRALFDF